MADFAVTTVLSHVTRPLLVETAEWRCAPPRVTREDPAVATDLITTRRSLHAVAELVLAGPQFRGNGDIRLRVRAGGFSTVVGPDVRVAEASVVRDDVVVPIDGQTPAAIANELGLHASGLDDVYSGGCGAGLDDVLAASPDHAGFLATCFVAGEDALTRFAPEAERTLWPEHFDVAIRVDEVNYGVSPGDDQVPEPYAYVGPAKVTDDPFWTAPFGAVLRLAAQPSVDAIVAFFTAGRAVATAR